MLRLALYFACIIEQNSVTTTCKDEATLTVAVGNTECANINKNINS